MNHPWRASLLLVAGLSLGLGVGCSSSETTDGSTAEAPEKVFEIREGMTKEEVIAMYEGEPDRKMKQSDGSETWTYHVNAGQAWIPFNYGYRPEFHEVRFGPDGKVTAYTLSE